MGDRHVYLVEKLELDHLENRYDDAAKYVRMGYTVAESIDDPYIKKMRAIMITEDGWPLDGKPTPKYRITQLRKIHLVDGSST